MRVQRQKTLVIEYMKIQISKIILLAWMILAVFSQLALADGQAPQTILQPLEELTVQTRSGEYKFTVEVADEPHERSTGLMFREEMASNHGMLFDFGRTEIVAMWMKNTPLSLDMIFISSDGTVRHVARNTVPYSTDIITSNVPVSHVLEINSGVGKLIGLGIGDRIEHRLFE